MSNESTFAMRAACISLTGFVVWAMLLMVASCSRGPTPGGAASARGSGGSTPAARQIATTASLNGESGVSGGTHGKNTEGPGQAGGTGAASGSGALETAMFGAGCFWGVEDFFMQLDGVKETAVGFAGGENPNPTYKEVCTTDTGHAEVVWVRYDPAVIGYDKLVDAFFRLHDPTQLNRQGPDVGTQYRSVVFCFSEAQRATATAAKERLTQSKAFPRPIVTEIEGPPGVEFFRAEEYHQKYLLKNGLSSCHVPR